MSIRDSITLDNPLPLSKIAAETLTINPSYIADFKDETNEYKLKNSVFLPAPVAECLFKSFKPQLCRSQESKPALSSLFTDKTRFPLQQLDLSGTAVTDDQLVAFLKGHADSLTYLNVEECSRLTDGFFDTVRKNLVDSKTNEPITFHQMLIMNLGNQVSLFSKWVESRCKSELSKNDVAFSMDFDSMSSDEDTDADDGMEAAGAFEVPDSNCDSSLLDRSGPRESDSSSSYHQNNEFQDPCRPYQRLGMTSGRDGGGRGRDYEIMDEGGNAAALDRLDDNLDQHTTPAAMLGTEGSSTAFFVTRGAGGKEIDFARKCQVPYGSAGGTTSHGDDKKRSIDDENIRKVLYFTTKNLDRHDSLPEASTSSSTGFNSTDFHQSSLEQEDEEMEMEYPDGGDDHDSGPPPPGDRRLEDPRNNDVPDGVPSTSSISPLSLNLAGSSPQTNESLMLIGERQLSAADRLLWLSSDPESTSSSTNSRASMVGGRQSTASGSAREIVVSRSVEPPISAPVSENCRAWSSVEGKNSSSRRNLIENGDGLNDDRFSFSSSSPGPSYSSQLNYHSKTGVTNPADSTADCSEDVMMVSKSSRKHKSAPYPSDPYSSDTHMSHDGMTTGSKSPEQSAEQPLVDWMPHVLKSLPGRRRRSTLASAIHYVATLTGRCPNLLALTLTGELWESFFPECKEFGPFFSHLLDPVQHLQYLDLSYWPLEDLKFVNPLSHLETLVLHDVPHLHRMIDMIFGIKTLKNLDISQTDAATGTYPRPASTLFRLVQSLPRLESLDISSTNLPSHPDPTLKDWPSDVKSPPSELGPDLQSDIVGLRGLHNRLKFLGLYNCNNSSHYAHLPADQVSGDANEDQVLLACEKYLGAPGLLRLVLSDAYRFYRYGESRQHAKAVQLVLHGMERHIQDVNVQVSGTAALYYIMNELTFGPQMKRKVINGFLSALREHIVENLLVRNCCLSLCQFEIPQDLMFIYKDAIEMMIQALSTHPDDTLTQRILVYVMNSMACHVDGEQKITAGNLGAVEKILKLVRKRVDDGICDDMMEVSWSFLWNITDETPQNCARFLDDGGMDLFLDCFNSFNDKTELLRNMMGLMGNIAEVDYLRPQLMPAKFVSAFCVLLKNMSDGIEISYNSAGVLAHMCSDGEGAWISEAPSRDFVMVEIVNATKLWDLAAKRFINYRSFEPIFRLVPCFDCYAGQHWAIWALANLTTVDSKKYCSFVMAEGGVPLLKAILADDRPSPELRQLTKKVLDNVREWTLLNAESNFKAAVE